MKLNFAQVLRPPAAAREWRASRLAIGRRVCWGVTAGNESHNASNARGVTAGTARLDATLVYIIQSLQKVMPAHYH